MKNCHTKYCRNDAAAGRNICNTCKSRRYRKADEMRYAFSTLRSNAKRRHKIFALTFQQFKKWAIKYRYVAGKGRSKDSYTIDRIDNAGGYTLDNIRILTKSENSRKGARVLIYDPLTKYATVI